MLSYSHPPLEIQLGNYTHGVRQVLQNGLFLLESSYLMAYLAFFSLKVELDVHVSDGTFLVFHVQLLDDHTT